MAEEKGKSGLSERDVKKLKKSLLAQKKQLESALRAEVSGSDRHSDFADRGNSELMVALTVREQGRKREELALVMGALERIEKGIIGICQNQDCEGDGSIALTRLMAVPQAILCIECQTEQETKFKKK